MQNDFKAFGVVSIEREDVRRKHTCRFGIGVRQAERTSSDNLENLALDLHAIRGGLAIQAYPRLSYRFAIRLPVDPKLAIGELFVLLGIHATDGIEFETLLLQAVAEKARKFHSFAEHASKNRDISLLGLRRLRWKVVHSHAKSDRWPTDHGAQ